MKSTTLALLAALIGAPGLAQAQSTDALQLRSWASACANCHGTDGSAQPGMPSLVGSSREDMLRTLLEYKNGVRPATVMHQLAKGYTDEQLAALAGYFASLPR